MTADFDVILNFNSATPVKTGAEFKAGDKGFTINMDVRELDPTGMTPKIAFYRSNGTSVESSAVTNVGNVFSYTLLGNELAVPGIVVADLKFYDGDDQRVSSASFIFTAIADTLDGLGGGTESYSDELEQLSAEFQDTLDDYIDAFGNTAPINPRGDYDANETYEPRDMVYDSNTGTSWVAKVETTGHAPANGSAYWQKLVNSSGSASLGDLDDVDTTGATSGQLLGFDGDEWTPVHAPAAGTSNLNLFTNSWFMVNQRGVTSKTVTAQEPFVDNWNVMQATYAVQADTSINLKANVTQYGINQQLSAPLTNGQTYTFSAEIGGNIYSDTFTYAGSSMYTGYLYGGIRGYVNTSDLFWIIADDTTTTYNFRRVKLEVGSVSTMNLDTAPNPTLELLEAQHADMRVITSIVAEGSTNTTGAQIPNGAYFYLNGVFCRAIADIATNATFTKNTNYVETNAGVEIETINSNGFINNASFILTSPGNSQDMSIDVSDMKAYEARMFLIWGIYAAQNTAFDPFIVMVRASSDPSYKYTSCTGGSITATISGNYLIIHYPYVYAIANIIRTEAD